MSQSKPSRRTTPERFVNYATAAVEYFGGDTDKLVHAAYYELLTTYVRRDSVVFQGVDAHAYDADYRRLHALLEDLTDNQKFLSVRQLQQHVKERSSTRLHRTGLRKRLRLPRPVDWLPE